MPTSAVKDKFIAFVDVLGFKQMVQDAESGAGRSFSEIQDIVDVLRNENGKSFFKSYGPQVCPESRCVRKDLDFESTQVSDCVIASSEISPAGVINLVNICWSAAITLLTKGVLVRGYITRGNVMHNERTLLGTGYHRAYEREGEVRAFQRDADEKGTPFIEVDDEVCTYVRNETDPCVREMFSRYVKSDGSLTAIFPFQRLSHSIAIGGFGVPPFNPEKEKKSNDIMRQNIRDMQAKLKQYVDPGNERAVKKLAHYLYALDEQLVICDRTDEAIEMLSRPFPRRG